MQGMSEVYYTSDIRAFISSFIREGSSCLRKDKVHLILDMVINSNKIMIPTITGIER